MTPSDLLQRFVTFWEFSDQEIESVIHDPSFPSAFLFVWFPSGFHVGNSEYSVFVLRKYGTPSLIQLTTPTSIHTMDPIAQTYIKMRRINEARYIKHEVNPLSNKASRMTGYLTSRHDPMYSKMDGDVVLHRHIGGGETYYATLDHSSHEELHHALFNYHEAGDRLPFEHETQDVVEKIDHPALGKGYATGITYAHFINSKFPLSSSDSQQLGGHMMWRKLAHRAFDDGYHVYHWNNLDRTLNRLTTKTEVDGALNKYFSATEPRTMDHGHIIISKEMLKSS